MVPPPPPKQQSGLGLLLQSTGIPPSWVRWRPKLPSRNWLIFLSTSGSLVGLYAYDRWKCNQIRTEYINKVKHLADESLPTTKFPRKVTVYGAKWPDDEDADVGLKYFRRYIKPILNAAAVDYEMVKGRRLGDLADKVCEDIKERRRVDLGITPKPPIIPLPVPGQTLPEQRQRELDGAIIVVGRQTFKEFMDGLKRGWTDPPIKVDREEQLARELEADGVFDEDNSEISTNDQNQTPQIANAFAAPHIPSQYVSSFNPPRSSVPPEQKPFQDKGEYINTPISMPQYPPLLLVPFVNYVGFRHIPRMLWNFFNRRKDVKLGAEAAHRLITTSPRPIRGTVTTSSEGEVESSPLSDLSFGLEAESFYKSKPPSVEIEKARKSYYKYLPEKISTARQLARGEREPTKDERNFPPPTEVELRAERMKKEKRWRGTLAGWEIIKPSAPVAWDPRFTSALMVYPRSPDESTSQDGKIDFS